MPLQFIVKITFSCKVRDPDPFNLWSSLFLIRMPFYFLVEASGQRGRASNVDKYIVKPFEIISYSKLAGVDHENY